MALSLGSIWRLWAWWEKNSACPSLLTICHLEEFGLFNLAQAAILDLTKAVEDSKRPFILSLVVQRLCMKLYCNKLWTNKVRSNSLDTFLYLSQSANFFCKHLSLSCYVILTIALKCMLYMVPGDIFRLVYMPTCRSSSNSSLSTFSPPIELTQFQWSYSYSHKELILIGRISM